MPVLIENLENVEPASINPAVGRSVSALALLALDPLAFICCKIWFEGVVLLILTAWQVVMRVYLTAGQPGVYPPHTLL